MLKLGFSSEKNNDLLFYLFLISFFLFKIPNFYLFIFFKNQFFTSQAIARFIVIIVFLCNIYLYLIKKKRRFWLIQKDKLLINAVLILFVLQSFSILFAINLESFLYRYKDVCISLFFFILAAFYKDRVKEIIFVLFLSSFLNIIYQFILVFRSDFFIRIVSNFIYQKHLNYVIANLDRGRIYIDTFDEMIIPFLFLNFEARKLFSNVLKKILIILIIIFSFLSNFRTRVLMVFFALITSFLILLKKRREKEIRFIFLIMMIILIFSNFSSFYIRGINRFNNIDEILNTTSIMTRIDQIKISFNMGRLSLFGVGLGNYYDNLPSLIKNKDMILSKSISFIKQGAEEYVHNVFGFIVSESGYLGLITFLYILSIFLRNDFFLLKKNNEYDKALIISFWTIFIYGLFNPIIPASYQVLFWTLRGLLIK